MVTDIWFVFNNIPELFLGVEKLSPAKTEMENDGVLRHRHGVRVAVTASGDRVGVVLPWMMQQVTGMVVVVERY
jgi:hypothetical protein